VPKIKGESCYWWRKVSYLDLYLFWRFCKP